MLVSEFNTVDFIEFVGDFLVLVGSTSFWVAVRRVFHIVWRSLKIEVSTGLLRGFTTKEVL